MSDFGNCLLLEFVIVADGAAEASNNETRTRDRRHCKLFILNGNRRVVTDGEF